jgi:hypothetical protein
MNTDTFDALIARARLPLSDDERERLARLYPVVEAQVAELRLPEARYAEPADIFPAAT